jgi:hypothetical protein
MKANEENEIEIVEYLALFGDKFKGKCRNCGAKDHKAQDCKKRLNKMVETTEIHKMALKLKNKTSRNKIALSNLGNNGNYDQRNFDSTNVAFMATTKPMKLVNDAWICDS